MDRFRVVIAGGGIAAVEGLLRLRRLVGQAVVVTLLTPDEDCAIARSPSTSRSPGAD